VRLIAFVADSLDTPDLSTDMTPADLRHHAAGARRAPGHGLRPDLDNAGKWRIGARRLGYSRSDDGRESRS
jgi:hypothetical protein